MECPNCSSELSQVTLEDKYYCNKLVVDQCDKCGGVWFDSHEIYQIDNVELAKYNSCNKEKYLQETKQKEVLTCPKDGTILLKFKNGSLIDHLNFQICPACQGIWTNVYDLKKFGARKVKISHNQKEREVEVGDTALEIMSSIHSDIQTPFDAAKEAYLSDPRNNPGNISRKAVSAIRALPKEERLRVYQGFAQEKEKNNQEVAQTLSVLNHLYLFIGSLLKM
jgi:Zn-finger nucleic acid-binding protein